MGQSTIEALEGFEEPTKMGIISCSTDLSSGSEGKVVCLVSGGTDSPIAAWLLMKKRCVPVFVFYDNFPFTGEDTKQRALDVIRRLSDFVSGCRVKSYIVPHGDDLADILRNCPRNLTCVLCRRMMYRLAEGIAFIEGAEAIVTGEIIGEHASQTMRNLCVENEALKEFPVLRPVLGMNKLEVERLARKIGTFQISSRPALCCSAPPKHPRTRAKLEEVKAAERNLRIKDMVERDLTGVEVVVF